MEPEQNGFNTTEFNHTEFNNAESDAAEFSGPESCRAGAGNTAFGNAESGGFFRESSLQIRQLKAEEITSGLQLAALNYHVCLEPSVKDPQMNRYFYEYLDPEKITRQQKDGSLYLWGALAQNTLLGVSAMTNTGQITMLYVHPDYQKQGIGGKLLDAMVDFAPQLYLNRISVNAAPGWTGRWFGYEGFKSIKDEFDCNASYNPMIMKLSGVREYPVKKVPEGRILAAVLGTLAACTVLTAGYTLYFIFH